MAGERVSVVPREAQQPQQRGEARPARFNPFGLITREGLMNQQKPEKAAAEQNAFLPIDLKSVKEKPSTEADAGDVITSEDGKIVTRTKAGALEMGADLSAGGSKWTGGGGIAVGGALAPFGIGIPIAAGGFYDFVSGDWFKGYKESKETGRLLYEADENKHKITINNAPDDLYDDPSQPIPLKAGYVKVLSHNVNTQETVVDVNHKALPHEAAVFVAPAKEDKKEKAEDVTQEDVALAA